jgi:hypothetical protein
MTAFAGMSGDVSHAIMRGFQASYIISLRTAFNSRIGGDVRRRARLCPRIRPRRHPNRRDWAHRSALAQSARPNGPRVNQIPKKVRPDVRMRLALSAFILMIVFVHF